MRLTNCCFKTIFSHFFANYINVFLKTEFQTVIFRFWTGLYPNWLKCYDTNEEQAKMQKMYQLQKTTQIRVFFTKLQKKWKYLRFEPIKVDPFSTSKWTSKPQFCERYSCNWQKKWLEMVVKRPLVSRRFWWSRLRNYTHYTDILFIQIILFNLILFFSLVTLFAYVVYKDFVVFSIKSVKLVDFLLMAILLLLIQVIQELLVLLTTLIYQAHIYFLIYL